MLLANGSPNRPLFAHRLPPAAVTPTTTLNLMFNNYGNGAGCADWSGGDGTHSVRLPSGKIAWLFADTYVGSPALRQGAFWVSMVRNSIVVQNVSSPRTITGGNTRREGDLSRPFGTGTRTPRWTNPARTRPGWFDYNAADENKPVFLQGDQRRSGGPSDGAVSRRQIAQILVAGLASEAANGKTFELVAEQGPAPADLGPLFAAVDPDEPGSLDAVHDEDNVPLSAEPARVRADLDALRAPESDARAVATVSANGLARSTSRRSYGWRRRRQV